MSWQWYETDDEDKEQNKPATSPQIYNDTIYKRVDSENDSYRGDLSIVPLPQYYKYKRAKTVGHHALMLLDRLKAKYKPGQIVSFDDITKLGSELGFNKDRTAQACLRLWAKGYLRKWAEGIWRGGFIAKTRGKVGKYYGVHYELIERQSS